MLFAILGKVFNAATYYALQLAMPRRSRCGGVARRSYRYVSTVGRQGEWNMRPYLTAMFLGANLMVEAATAFAQSIPIFTPDRPLFTGAANSAPVVNGQVNDLQGLRNLLEKLNYKLNKNVKNPNLVEAVFALDDLDIPIQFKLSRDKSLVYLQAAVMTDGSVGGVPLAWDKMILSNDDIYPAAFSYMADVRQLTLRYPIANFNITADKLDDCIADFLEDLKTTRSIWGVALPRNRESASSRNDATASADPKVSYPPTPFPGSTPVAADKPQATSQEALSVLNRVQDLRSRAAKVMVSLGQSSEAILLDKPYTLTQIYKDQKRSDVVLQQMSEELDQMEIGTDTEIQNFKAASKKAFQQEVAAYLKLMQVSVTAIEEVDDTALMRQLAKNVIRNGVGDFNRELTAAGTTYEQARTRLAARFNLTANP
ncbi:MAG: hypothetical protein K8U03_22665 [Planctomycetia bacterium]|nr:hypothetical protein [Planctomycetia bacterium]